MFLSWGKRRHKTAPAETSVRPADIDTSLVPTRAAAIVMEGTCVSTAREQHIGNLTSSANDDSEPTWPSLADLIAPAAVEVFRDALCIDDEWVRVLTVTGYPRYVYPGWLDTLIDLDEPFELSLQVRPLESPTMVRALSRRLVQLQSSRLLDQRRGRLADPEREVAYADVERLRAALQRGDERVFSLSCYLLVRGQSRTQLDERCARIVATLDNLQMQSRAATLEHDLGLTSCLPEGRDRLLRYRNFDTSSLSTAFPFTSSSLSMASGVLYGVVPSNGSLVILDPFAQELENANQVVFAKSGAGKSYACKLQALRALLLGTEVVVVDPEDEYQPLCDAVGGQSIRLAPGSGQHVNPFDLPPVHVGADADGDGADTADTGDLLAEKVQSLHALLDLMLADRGPSGATGLTQREKGLLDRCVYETYRRMGITSDRRTHDRPAPLLRDLYAVLRSGTCGSDEFGLADRLHRYVEGSLARLFSAPTDVALDRHFVVFNVCDLDGELRPLGLLLIADFVWTRVRQSFRPRQLLIDEAWTLIQHTEGGRFLAGLARRARKHFLGLVTITQDVEDFLSSEWGRTVLANSSIQLLMKQDSTTIEAVTQAFHLSGGERQYLLGCHKGEGLLFARGAHVGLRVEASPAEHALVTTDPRELAERARSGRGSLDQRILWRKRTDQTDQTEHQEHMPAMRPNSMSAFNPPESSLPTGSIGGRQQRSQRSGNRRTRLSRDGDSSQAPTARSESRPAESTQRDETVADVATATPTLHVTAPKDTSATVSASDGTGPRMASGLAHLWAASESQEAQS